MSYILILLVVVGFVALALSYLKDSSTKRLEDQIEGTSITMMQELYKVKKKIRVLEEELMLDEREQ